jgi:undecaprenyl-diphosphatase
MLERILNWDYTLFKLINQGMSNDFFDYFLVWSRNSYTWLPLYLFIIAFFFYNLGKRSYWIILFCILTVLSSDTVSSIIIKKNVKRDRPCRSVCITHAVVRVKCGKAYSFTSSHATNHFAIATFLALTIGVFFKWIKQVLWTWAAVIGFAQVYVGVHFPFDVLVGSVNGILIGWFWSWMFNKYYFNTLGVRFDPYLSLDNKGI